MQMLPSRGDPKYFRAGCSRSYIFVTNARLLWMSSNNDGVVSIPWVYMTKIRIGRKRFKNTLGFSFKRLGWSSDNDYPAEYVSREVVRAIEQIQSGQVPTFELPAEPTTAVKVHKPHGDSNMGQIFRMYGYPEARLACSMCGKSAGVCGTDGDDLSDECEGCERSFSEIITP